MNQTTIIALTLIFYKTTLLLVGFLSRSRTSTIQEYFLGGKKIGPIITSISYAASNSSAWTLLGVSGIAYSNGLSTVWLVLGVIIGMFLSWMKLAIPLLRISRSKNLITIPQIITSDYSNEEKVPIHILSSFIIIFSFSFYIASQFQGAGNAFNDTLGLSVVHSVAISAIVIFIYTYMGGFLAVSITDTIQGFLMAMTALIMPIAALVKLGGFSVFLENILNDSSSFSSLTAGNFGLMTVGLIGGNLGIGLGYFGQPHLLSRFIAAKDEDTLFKARNYALAWFVLVFFGMWMLGLIGHYIIEDLNNNENIFFKLSDELFHPVVQGILTAAVISAIMSTADSQILICASSISLDMGLKIKSNPLRISRWVTGLVILSAALIAIYLPDKIFSRVLFAWTAIGSAFGPAMISKLLGWRLNYRYMLLAIALGFSLAILFFYLPNTIGDWVERIIPFAIGMAVIFLFKESKRD